MQWIVAWAIKCHMRMSFPRRVFISCGTRLPLGILVHDIEGVQNSALFCNLHPFEFRSICDSASDTGIPPRFREALVVRIISSGFDDRSDIDRCHDLRTWVL